MSQIKRNGAVQPPLLHITAPPRTMRLCRVQRHLGANGIVLLQPDLADN